MTVECDFSGRENCYFGLRHQRNHLSDCATESTADRGRISKSHEPSFQVATIRDVDFGQCILPFVQFIQVPFGRVLVEMGDTLTSKGTAPLWQKQLQAFHHAFACLRLPAKIKPQNSECERCVYGSLCFLAVDSKYSKSGLPMPDQSARIDRPKRTLQVD